MNACILGGSLMDYVQFTSVFLVPKIMIFPFLESKTANCSLFMLEVLEAPLHFLWNFHFLPYASLVQLAIPLNL